MRDKIPAVVRPTGQRLGHFQQARALMVVDNTYSCGLLKIDRIRRAMGLIRRSHPGGDRIQQLLLSCGQECSLRESFASIGAALEVNPKD